MRTKLLGNMIAVATVCTAIGALGQATSGDNQSPGTTDPTSPNTGSVLSPTGRMEHNNVRASKLMGAAVKSATGEELGTISDVIVNPASGRIEFGVVALTSTQGTANTAANTGEKLVPVPWSLLRPSAPARYEAGSRTGASEQTFTFTGDHTKLQAAPSFDQNNWPDISRTEWRESIFSYYGVPAGSATGGAQFPGGRSTGTGASPGTYPTTPNPTYPPK